MSLEVTKVVTALINERPCCVLQDLLKSQSQVQETEEINVPDVVLHKLLV